MAEMHASIGNLFPPFLANLLFEILEVATSSHLGKFSIMHNFNGIVQ